MNRRRIQPISIDDPKTIPAWEDPRVRRVFLRGTLQHVLILIALYVSALRPLRRWYWAINGVAIGIGNAYAQSYDFEEPAP